MADVDEDEADAAASSPPPPPPLPVFQPPRETAISPSLTATAATLETGQPRRVSPKSVSLPTVKTSTDPQSPSRSKAISDPSGTTSTTASKAAAAAATRERGGGGGVNDKRGEEEERAAAGRGAAERREGTAEANATADMLAALELRNGQDGMDSGESGRIHTPSVIVEARNRANATAAGEASGSHSSLPRIRTDAVGTRPGQSGASSSAQNVDNGAASGVRFDRPAHPRNPSTGQSSGTVRPTPSSSRQQQRISPPFATYQQQQQYYGYPPEPSFVSYGSQPHFAAHQLPLSSAYAYGSSSGEQRFQQQQFALPVDAASYASSSTGSSYLHSPPLHALSSPYIDSSAGYASTSFSSLQQPPSQAPSYYAAASGVSPVDGTSPVFPSTTLALSSGAQDGINTSEVAAPAGPYGTDANPDSLAFQQAQAQAALYGLPNQQQYAYAQSQPAPYYPSATQMQYPISHSHEASAQALQSQSRFPPFQQPPHSSSFPHQHPPSHFQQQQYPQQQPSFRQYPQPPHYPPPGAQQSSFAPPFRLPPPPPLHQQQQSAYYAYPPPPVAMQGYNLAAAAAMSSPPQVYAPPPGELARGHLAQSRFHDAIFDRDRQHEARARRRSSGTGGLAIGEGLAPSGLMGRLPRPPQHSPHALWVGNVPSDATHAELWRFFSSRPPPATNPRFAHFLAKSPGSPTSASASVSATGELGGADLHTTGIDSIHLIQKSNCAFVNYASDVHLQHSIEVSNGVPLRPLDPKCKELVCRVRKKDEDAKSGVGAQRIGGMHKDFVREQVKEKREQRERDRECEIDRTSGPEDDADRVGSSRPGTGSTDAPSSRSAEDGTKGHQHSSVQQQQHQHAHRHSTSSTLRSISTTSTTSSFLAKHFEKRYFILKSHDESDLKLSVERGLWATQLHNEPVLDQAFHTAKDVYLIFGANRRGEFFGYGRMSSAIHDAKPHASASGANLPDGQASIGTTSSNSQSSSSGNSKGTTSSTSNNARPDTIDEEREVKDFSARQPAPPMLFNDTENRLVETSPLPLTPGGSRPVPGSAPASLSPAARREFQTAGGRLLDFTLSNASLPGAGAQRADPDGTASQARGESLDPKLLVKREAASAGSNQAVVEQQIAGSSSVASEVDEDGVWRKDTLPTAEERNARLEQLDPEDKPKSLSLSSGSGGWGHPFKVEWLKVARLSFAHTRHIRNAFNAGREVKISRDGTELEPSAGEALIAEFWALDAQSPSTARMQQISPGSDTPQGPSPVEGVEALTQASGLVGASSRT